MSIAICAQNFSKCYQKYNAPRDWLKQFVLQRLKCLAGQAAAANKMIADIERRGWI